MKEYTITEEQKQQFSGVYVLEYMVNRPKAFSLLLEGGDKDLESILEWLLMMEYIEIHQKEKYIPTEKGRKLITRFLGRYTEFLNVFDIYCAIDLQVGEFAFESYFEIEEENEWLKLLRQENWEDLRVAVAEYKKLDPIEIVFMSFVSEGRFGKDEAGWQFDLLLGSVWDEIVEICNNAIHWDQLGFDSEAGAVSAESVIEDIIKQGAEIMIDLHDKEATLSEALREDDDDDSDEETYVERVVIEEYEPDYYHGYRDPFYVSPLFIGLLILM